MHNLLKIISLLTLVAVILPSILFLAGRVELETVEWLMLVASIVWFVAATLYGVVMSSIEHPTT